MAKLSNQELYSTTIKKVVNKELTQKEASIKLGISDRQIRRIVTKYKKIGDDAFVHKNSGQPSHNKKIPNDIADEIIDDYLSEFSDFGFTHFYEEQGYKYGISFSAMVTLFEKGDIISPYAHHKTVKLYNESMKKAIRENNLTEEKRKLYNQRKQEELEKHIRKSTLNYSFGEQVQMDAAFWIWFGNESAALHLAVDKATKKVLSGWFDYEETTEAYTVVLMKIIEDCFQGCRNIRFNIENTPSTKESDGITKILDEWSAYRENVFERLYCMPLNDLVNSIYSQDDFEDSQFGKKLITSLL